MPVDPLHGRRVPSGRRLARVLAAVFRSMLPAARSAVARGRVPELAGFDAAVVRAVLPLVYHEWHLGREQVARDLRRQAMAVGGNRGRKAGVGSLPPVVKAGYPFGDPSGGPPPPPPPPAPPLSPAGTAGMNLSLSLLRDAIPLAVQQLVLALVGSITDTIRDDIRGRLETGVRAGESNAQVADRLDDLFSPRRAYTIAATEASRAAHAGEESYAKEAGAAGLEWLASGDACADVCLPLSGKRVRFGEPFVVHARGRAEYRAVYHPPAHPRCMCSCVPWFEEQSRAVRRA